ncbi:efflux RND transporter periplasmic adaptor subunit [Roseiterribacter gracilis]|uniref:Multidrug resistance protein MdtA n=1 Tax=Roseiterribacter gracilis TaxID=2812848 RepID=A0A8S8XB05_9PROT|nr:multidrug resistance protein MdtA [Rhodospirillales bacterium TMPK1]
MKNRNLILGSVAALLLVVVVYAVAAPPRETNAARGATGNANAPEVAVAIARVEAASIYIRSVGTVRPIKSVQILPLVDGPIMRVAFTDGQMLNAGDVLFEIDARPYQAALAQAEGQLARDQADLESASRDLARTEQLNKNGYATGQALDQQKSRVGQLNAALKTDQGKIAQTKIDLDRTTIRAPIAGRVSLAAVTEGNVVRASQTVALTSINLLAPIEVQFTVPQERLPDVQARMQQQKPLLVHTSNSENTLRLADGTLTFMDNRVDPTTGTVQMKARFDNVDGKLWPGQFVNVELELDRNPQAIVVDSRAIQTGPDGRYVFIVNADDTVEARKVKLAVLEDKTAIVSEGLVGGERLVIDGQLKIQPKGKVRVRGASGAMQVNETTPGNAAATVR